MPDSEVLPIFRLGDVDVVGAALGAVRFETAPVNPQWPSPDDGVLRANVWYAASPPTHCSPQYLRGEPAVRLRAALAQHPRLTLRAGPYVFVRSAIASVSRSDPSVLLPGGVRLPLTGYDVDRRCNAWEEFLRQWDAVDG